MKAHHPHRRRDRARIAAGIIGLVIGAIAFQFFRVQVLQSSDDKLQAESNRLRLLPIPAPRGTIYDRNGLIIADNIPGYAVYVLAAPRDSMKVSLRRLQPLLDLSDPRIEVLGGRIRRNQPLLVDVDADLDAVAALQERSSEFPGIYIEMRPKRRYRSGAAIGHALGFVSEIAAEELATSRFTEYEQGMLIGKAGIERQYEELLQGTRGVRILEVDATGRLVGSFAGREENPSLPGEDVHLNLDLPLMEWIHSIFPDSMRGAVVALDPADGAVLALYSAPTMDPNDFVGGIETDLWNELSSDHRQPLFNRAVLGRYAPASTWKLAAAGIALDAGVVGPTEVMPVPCTGGITILGQYKRCWNPEGHGFLDLAGAIANSCNVYFYQLGVRVGLDRLLDAGTRLGFSGRCGIDLPEENPGVFPRDRNFWVDVFGYRPLEGEVLSLAIGQGPNDQTPLKMAQFYTALARDGSAPAPRLRKGTDPTDSWRLELSRVAIEELRKGMRGVTAPGGTAYFGTALEHWEVIGKTGSGQNPQDPERPHAWFAGMAGPPGEEPEIVVVVLVEFGESGSRMAAPIAAKAVDFYLRQKYGIPIDTVQTLAEHFAAGLPAPWANQ